MFDWYTGLIGYNAENLETGRILVLSPGGEINFSSERWRKVTGSYESSLQIKKDSSTPEMRAAADKHNLVCSPTVFKMSGNPTKFLQGHNVFGPSVVSLAPIVQGIIRNLPGDLRPPDADSNLWPSVHRIRIDVTTSISMENHNIVHEWISHAQQETRSRHRRQQSGLTGSTTVSWGTGSSRWMITAYCKYCELEKHPPSDLVFYEQLREYADGLLRIELRLMRKELKERGTLDESLIWQYFDRIQVGVIKDDIETGISSMRPSVKNIYTLWLDGHDVSPASGRIKRAAFYKYRKEILEATGQDISLPPVKKVKSGAREQFNVEFLKAHEVKEIPEHLQKYLLKPGDSPIWPAH